ncbi:MAG: hypothetical protein ACOCQD_04365 [archaeon]
MSEKIKDAIETLEKCMKEDEDYAMGWHANIAVRIQDEGVDHKTSNLAADRIMQGCFNINMNDLRI